MIAFDDYVIDVLMRDLTGHDRKPTSFLVYLWIAAQQSKSKRPVQVSYQEMAESIGVSKSSAQAATAWLLRRKLLSAVKENATAIPSYTIHRPWAKSSRNSPGFVP